MAPRPQHPLRRGIVRLLFALALALFTASPAQADEGEAQRRRGEPPARDRREAGEGRRGEAGGGEGDEQVFEFSGLDIGGRLRTPQLLYFLDRAREELRQASLERRSFLPEMIRSVDEESL